MTKKHAKLPSMQRVNEFTHNKYFNGKEKRRILSGYLLLFEAMICEFSDFLFIIFLVSEWLLSEGV